MELMWELSKDGYISQYMMAGPKISDFHIPCQRDTQLEFETALRGLLLPVPKEKIDERTIKTGMLAECGMPWHPYISHSNVYVDESNYWKDLKKIECEVSACLITTRTIRARVRFWSYMAANIYLNGKQILAFNRSVYKPIMYQDIEVDLHTGRNVLYMDCVNLGARESRIIIGVQFLDHREDISIAMVDEVAQHDAYAFDHFIRSIHIDGERVCFEHADGNLSYRLEQTRVSETGCVTGMKQMTDWRPLENVGVLNVPKDSALVEIRIDNGQFSLSREIEFYDRRKMVFQKGSKDINESLKEILGQLAENLPERNGKFSSPTSIADVIARALLGKEHACDLQVINNVLEVIEKRYDCAEFELGSLLRYMRIHPITDAQLADHAQRTITGFRYWESEPGWDALCFWSENHAISFYTCQIMAGEMYPDVRFTSSGLLGKELAQRGRILALEWLEAVKSYGFEEFLSATYLNVTLGALLNLVDFADDVLSEKAVCIIDTLMYKIAIHTFHGSLIAPMGRIYRSVIYPFTEDCQSLICLFNPDAPRAGEAKWLSFLVGSKYRFPAEIAQMMKAPYHGTYEMGNALITIEKRDEYCLTSAASPRQDGYVRWHNCLFDVDVDKNTNTFCRSENESFHGTSYFLPGSLGFQQHLWSAALSAEAIVFANHPGTPAEKSAMRPGYWHGNYIVPAVAQGEHYITSIYVIPESAPVQFTHAYVPLKCVDAYLQEENWFFLKKGQGYLALWCSDAFVGFNDKVFGCEYRAYSTNTAYFCLAATESECSTLESFVAYAKAFRPVYEPKEHRLYLKNELAQTWTKHEDPTQIMD